MVITEIDLFGNWGLGLNGGLWSNFFYRTGKHLDENLYTLAESNVIIPAWIQGVIEGYVKGRIYLNYNQLKDRKKAKKAEERHQQFLKEIQDPVRLIEVIEQAKVYIENQRKIEQFLQLLDCLPNFRNENFGNSKNSYRTTDCPTWD